MNAKQYRAALEALGLTQAGAAEVLGVSVRTAHGYANGALIPAPMVLVLWLAQNHPDIWAAFLAYQRDESE